MYLSPHFKFLDQWLYFKHFDAWYQILPLCPHASPKMCAKYSGAVCENAGFLYSHEPWVIKFV